MAKHMQCVQAIRNCMKKVKAEYHSIPPLRPSVVPIPRNLYSFFSYIVNIATVIILTMFQIIIMKILLRQLPELVIYGSTA